MTATRKPATELTRLVPVDDPLLGYVEIVGQNQAADAECRVAGRNRQDDDTQGREHASHHAHGGDAAVVDHGPRTAGVTLRGSGLTIDAASFP